MDGEIWLESKEGKGSTFSFTVKMEKSDEDARFKELKRSQNGLEAAIQKLQGIKVLLVEDSTVPQTVKTTK